MSQLYAAGDGIAGQLGLNDIFARNAFTQDYTASPDWVSIAASGASSAAIRANGTLWTCGSNSYGELGQSPANPLIFSQVGAVTAWAEIFVGTNHFMAIRTDGSLWSWGLNNRGQLGVGDTTNRGTPTQVGAATNWTQADGGIVHSAAVRADGTLWSWGRNTYGQLGHGDTTQRNSPVQVGADTNWAQVSAGLYCTLAIKTDGTLWLSGDLTAGQGAGQVDTFTQVGTATHWARVEAGNEHVFLFTTTGLLYAMGSDIGGKLGLGDVGYQGMPVQVGSDPYSAAAANSTHSLVLDSSASTGIVSGPLLFDVRDDRGVVSGALRITTSDILVILSNVASARLAISVIATGAASAALRFDIQPTTGAATAALRIAVSATGQASGKLAMAVTGGLITRDWGLRVTLDGVNVSDRLVGAVDVMAEEGAARTATLGIMPATGAVQPHAYSGRQITVDMLRGDVPIRLFTGRVDLPDYDMQRRVMRLTCSDDLQNKVAELDISSILAITGGGYHRAVHGEIADNWDYAQACVMTQAASLDASPHGGVRLTPWHGLQVWRVFGAADILDDSLAIDLPRRAELVNQVSARFDYRIYRLRQRWMGVSWHMSWWSNEAQAAGYRFPTVDSIRSALSAAGWSLYSMVAYPVQKLIPYGLLFGGLDPAMQSAVARTTGEVSSMSATLWQRHAQTVTERHAITVSAPTSVAANGVLSRELRGALATDWSPDGWETDIAQAPTGAGAGMDHAPGADRADAEAGMAAIIAQAKTTILGRHRDTRVWFDLPCLPELDLDRALEINHPRCNARGKVWSLRHSLDPDGGRAVTRVGLAISGVAASGIVTPTPLDPPDPIDLEAAIGADSYGQPHLTTWVAGQAAYMGNANGWLLDAPATITLHNVLDANGDTISKEVRNPWHDGSSYPETGFRVTLPGVPDSHRNPTELTADSAYQIEIPEDTLILY